MISATIKDQFAVLPTVKIQELERQVIEGGSSVVELMDRAASGIVEEILSHFTVRPTLILCGPGNNGGDAYAVALKLIEKGWPVEAMDIVGSSSEAAQHYKRLYKKPFLPFSTHDLDHFDLLIDGIFGIGLKRELPQEIQAFIHNVNVRRIPVVSIDMPTGVDSDTGDVRGASLHAKLTITFNYRKPAHLLYPGKLSCGDVILKDIGLGQSPNPNILVNHPELWFDDFPIPNPLDHKYHRGHALLLGGEEYTGATQLASLAARRAGAGLVSIACSEKTHSIYALSAPGTLTKIVRDSKGWVEVLKDVRKNAFLLGPGLEPTAVARERVLAALATKRPVILDAGALNAFAPENIKTLFSACHDQVIFTPHEGEFKEIFGSLGGSKIERTLQAARQSGAMIYLKGADSVIASPAGQILLQENAPPWLATAGTGDVLAGMILGFLAQGVKPLQACGVASWVHGESAQQAGFGMIAEDLLDHLQEALQGIPDHLVYL